MFRNCTAKSLLYLVVGPIPVAFDLLTKLQAIWHSQSLFAVNELPSITDLVANPPLIDVIVLTRLDTVDHTFVVFNPDIISGCCNPIDAWCPLEIPHTLLKEKVLVQQCAHRAYVNDVT